MNSANWRVKSAGPLAVTTNHHAHQNSSWNCDRKGYRGQSSGYPSKFNQKSNSSKAVENDPQALQAIAEGRRLYVGNVPYMAKTEDVEKLFTEGSYDVKKMNMSIDPFTGRNPSYCFVELGTKEQADRAMLELDGTPLLDRPVKVRLGVPKSRNDNSHGRGGSSFYNRGGHHEPTFNRWEREDAADHWQEPSKQGRRLYVGGLPRMANQAAVDADIRNLFQDFTVEAVSKIISPHESKHTQPGNHYYLFVDFPNVEEAEAAALALNGREAVEWGGKLRVSKAVSTMSRKVEEKDRWDEEQAQTEHSGDGVGRIVHAH
ncbi:MAG: hypothetical protein M1830_001994 [Pleopsidium flavum]|nr:MAG: hypothetical protein M1830_001994 [Pleopsidium flavum]